jgi:hypothetical protein
MNYDNEAQLNEEGIKLFGGIFEHNQLPLISIIPEKAELKGLGNREIFKVDLSQLKDIELDRIVLVLSKKNNTEKSEIKEYFKKLGFIPLRRDLVNVVCSKNLMRIIG